MTTMTNPDCLLNRKQFPISLFPQLTSEQLSSIVGIQSPNGYLENLSDYSWSFQYIPTIELINATEYNEEPKIGWPGIYLQFLEEDEKAAKYSPEYKGRDDWIKNQWINQTEVYPIFVIIEDNNYRVLDGYHRLAGAFYYNVVQIAIILGKK